MTATLQQAQQYARLKGTRVIKDAYKVSPDHQSITFVLESGPKLTFTGEELNTEIERLTAVRARQIDITDGVDEGEASAAGATLARSPRKSAAAKPKTSAAGKKSPRTKKGDEPPAEETPPAP